MMTWFPVCLFLALFASARLEPSRYAAAGPADGEDCTPSTFNSIICENDRLKFCAPNNKVMSTPCFMNGRQAYCNCENTACVAEKPTCSGETTTCYQANTKLPDNLDCHKFTFCNDKNEKSVLRCPGNLIYNPTSSRCEDQNTARCARIVCPRPGNTPQLIPFPQARNYYVLCFQGMGDVRKCSDEFYAVRNNACQFDCRMRGESGLFRDTNKDRCQKGYYYACRRAGTNFTTVQSKCSPGLIFDEKLGVCTAIAKCE